jgi:flagellar hook-associated protein 3 FlgL
MTTRISTLNLNALTLGSAMNVQAQYAQAETQESSGLVASDFATLGGTNSSEMLNLEDGIAQSQTWASDATTVGSRTQGMYTALGNMVTTVTSLESKISAASAAADNSTLVTTVKEIQTALAADMNEQQAGSYLFGGSNTAEAPVNLTNYPAANFSSASADTSYYKGDNNILSVRVSQQQTIDYGVTANSTGFEEALRASQTVIQAAGSTLASSTLTAASATTTPVVTTAGTININGGASVAVATTDSLQNIATNINTAYSATGITAQVIANSSGTYSLQISSGSSADLNISDTSSVGLSSTTHATSLQTALKTALALAGSSITSLANQQESVGAVSSALTSASQQQTTYVTYLQNSLSNVKDVDTAQAAAKVSQYQTQLQASYLAVAQISKISLAQYI